MKLSLNMANPYASHPNKARFGGVTLQQPAGQKEVDWVDIPITVYKQGFVSSGNVLQDIGNKDAQESITVFVDNNDGNDLQRWQEAGTNFIKRTALRTEFATRLKPPRQAALLDFNNLPSTLTDPAAGDTRSNRPSISPPLHRPPFPDAPPKNPFNP